MLQWLRRRSEAQRTAEELYGRVVAAARQPELYRAMGVADTPEGRFEMIALHLFLALEALKGKADYGQDIAQRTIEAFVADMDGCMREMGVGDLAVPKKVKRAAAAFYERAGAYRAALVDSGDRKLERALARYALGNEAAAGPQAKALSDYVRRVQASTSGQDANAILVGE
jgi:cytochrome b pre-mRNA-processing protein 3